MITCLATESARDVTAPPPAAPPHPSTPCAERSGGGAADGLVALFLLLSAVAAARRVRIKIRHAALIAVAMCAGVVPVHRDANAAGAVDPTFGSSGVLRPQLAPEDGLLMAVPLSGDRFLALACPWDYGCYRHLSLRRFARDGKFDATFGESGVAFFTLYPSYPVIVMERAGGALLLAGDDASTAGFLMAVTASGQPDPVFGGQAVLKLAQPVRALAVQADGKLLVATAPDPIECQSAGWTLQRLSASGVVDPTFGINGATTSLAVEGESGRNCDLTQIWAEPGGALVIQTSAGLRRLHSEGSLDTTFGTASGVTPAKGTVTRTTDGRFLNISGQLAAWLVRRYDVNGREDPSFGSGGVVSLDLATTMADFGSIDGYSVNRIAVLEGGDRYVASMQIEGRLKSTGEWTSGTFIVRFLSDGRVDAAFGKGGKVQLSRSAVLGNAGLFPQSDGRLIVAAGGAIYRLLSGEAPSPGLVIMGLAEPVPVVEGDRARIIVSRTGGAGTAITVSYQTVAQDALAELDFIPVSGRLSWAAGDDSDRVVEVQTVDDKVSEPNDGYPEFFSVRIAPAEGAPIVTVDEVWIGVADNEPPVALPAPPPAIPPPPIVPPTLPSGGSGGGGAIGVTEAIALLGLWLAGVLRRRMGGPAQV